jgi:hypothetical protein
LKLTGGRRGKWSSWAIGRDNPVSFMNSWISSEILGKKSNYLVLPSYRDIGNIWSKLNLRSKMCKCFNEGKK